MAEDLHNEPFDFGNVKRNTFLQAKGMHMPKAFKTGTTIAGVIYKDGVVLGADTRATEGSIVCDKNCEKIHYISNFIRCCGAGTSADTESITNLIRSQLEMHRLSTGNEPRVATAMTRLKQRLFQYQGNISAALVLGGVDATGSYLYTVHPHGSVDKLPFATMGSGSLAAMAIFEAGFKDDLSEGDAIELVKDAICAGIFNDLGSGSNVDICVINKDGAKYLRNYHTPNERLYRRKAPIHFPRGTTEWLKETEQIFKHKIVVEKLNDNNAAAAATSSSAAAAAAKDNKMDTSA